MMNIPESFDKEADRNMKNRLTLLYLFYFISPVWATFLFHGISLLPLPPFVVQMLALFVMLSLFGMSLHAFYTVFCRESVLIQGLVMLLAGFILFISLSLSKLNLMLACLTAGITIPLSVCGLVYILDDLSGWFKLIIIGLVVFIVILPAGFLYWGFMDALANIFSFQF